MSNSPRKRKKKNTVRDCEVCENAFLTNKYQPRKTCSNECFRELSRRVKLGKIHSLETKRKMVESAKRRWAKK